MEWWNGEGVILINGVEEGVSDLIGGVVEGGSDFDLV